MLIQRLLMLSLTAGLPLFAPLAMTLINAGWPGVGTDFSADPLAPQSALFGIAVAGLLAFAPLPRLRPDMLGIILLLALIGTFLPYSRPGTLSLAVLGLACAWTARRLSPRFLPKYVRVAVVTAAAVAAYGILQGVWNRLFAGVSLVNPFGDRVLSTLGNPTFLADYLALNLPLALSLALGAPRRPSFAAWALCSAVIASAIVLTGSKGGQAAAFLSCMGLLAFTAWTRKLDIGRAAVLGIAAALAAGILFLSTPAFKLSLSRWSDPKEGFSYSQRYEIARGTMALIAQAPLIGHGPGSFPVLFPAVQSSALDRELGVTLSVNHAHNDFLELASDLGIPGLGLILTIGLICVRAAPSSPTAAGLAFSLVAASVAMLANFVVFLPASLFQICVHAGLLFPALAARGIIAGGPALYAFRLVFGIWFALGALSSFLAAGYYDLGAKTVAFGSAGPARMHLENALEMNPGNRHAWQNLGRACELEKDWSGAVSAYGKAVELGPYQAITHLNLGRSEWGWYHESRDRIHLDRALASLLEAARLNPHNPSAREMGGELALAAGRNREAAFFLDGFPPGIPATPRMFWLRAKWLNRIGRSEDAHEAMQEGDILAAQTDIELAERRLAEGKPDEAERTARDLVERFPELPVAWEALGYVLSARGKQGEARDCFRRIVRISPSTVSAHLNIALISLNLSDLGAARAAWRRAQALSPENPEVRLTLARLLAREGRLNEAIREYSRLLETDPANDSVRKEMEALSR